MLQVAINFEERVGIGRSYEGTMPISNEGGTFHLFKLGIRIVVSPAAFL